MKNWDADHPKARLMARKRAAILEAAREAFLRLGYEGASMEAIAATADVSIMTLYRHAESKDDLFAAVIANACDPDDEAEQAEMAALAQKPLDEIVLAIGLIVQERLADPGTIALFRVVMAETSRFPELGVRAYRGLIGQFETMTAEFLARRSEATHLDAARRVRLAVSFIERLIGTDLLRTLLGLPGATPAERRQRAEEARDALLDTLALPLVGS